MRWRLAANSKRTRGGAMQAAPLFLLLLAALPSLVVPIHNSSAKGCAIIRPPRDGGIRYRGLTQEQIRSVDFLPVDYEIEYICRGNRVILGPKVRKCLPNRTWTDISQHSRCLLLCPRVWTSLENGQVTAKPPGQPVEGTVLHYRCHGGFILEGRNVSHCTKLGKWDAPKPICLYDKNDTGKTLCLVILLYFIIVQHAVQ
ncbi:gamma-aminobutyric acid type B receptor subunit 1-like [Nerophis ophidion]|uniref:gamma-aminobutyric acid type B receptor subunit 1-like n=1 Tax=Nerophis ophidion TaxID=159077 RepID=UPI002AE09DE9|nr:gamma-aminobutyric acid type B receptor subunit 1-like [Nerophis ophidion]